MRRFDPVMLRLDLCGIMPPLRFTVKWKGLLVPSSYGEQPAQRYLEPGVPVTVLNSGAVSVALDLTTPFPRILYWGPRIEPSPGLFPFLATLSDSQYGADGMVAHRRLPTVLPENTTGWIGTPGLSGHRAGRSFSPRLDGDGTHFDDDTADRQRVTSRAVDLSAGLAVTT